jgi:hypothetical protein
MSTIHSFVYFLAHQGHRGRDRMIVGFTTTCAMSAYHHLCIVQYYFQIMPSKETLQTSETSETTPMTFVFFHR